ncbi:MAG: 1-acyl-sn-glycerol-3-phosphate acyltransferase [Verrucomicrobia bacterium]|nr:1-acyl-sn-glycerol-3-phosphate acyltransferase [Verrucomicrobiota bacterium]
MNLLYRLGRFLFRLAFRFYFRWRVCHADRVPVDGPLILASSHASYLDPPLVGSGVSRVCHFLARATLFTNPLFGWVLREVCAIPVDRDGGSAAGLKTILNKLNEGGAIVLFPEGTRTVDGQLQKARSGIGLMALKSGAPVVPVRALGTFEAYGKGRRFPRPHRITLIYGEPMRFEQERAEAEACSRERLKVLYQEVADKIMEAIAGLEADVKRNA